MPPQPCPTLTPGEIALLRLARALRVDPEDAKNRLRVPIEPIPERPKLRLIHCPVE